MKGIKERTQNNVELEKRLLRNFKKTKVQRNCENVDIAKLAIDACYVMVHP